KYKGNKWGGKFLRAPDILFKVLEKGQSDFKPLENVAKDVKRGVTTGANKFFYVEDVASSISSEEFQRVKNRRGVDYSEFDENEDLRAIKFNEDFYLVESKYLTNVIKSPKECSSMKTSQGKYKYKILMVDKNADVDSSYLSDYIERGEEEEYNERRTLSSRNPWYAIERDRPPEIITPCGIGSTYKVYLNDADLMTDKRLYEVYSDREDKLATVLNSAIYMLTQELNSRVGLGDGLLDLTVYEVEETLIPDPDILEDSKVLEREINSVFDEFGIERNKPIREQEPSPLSDRKELDDIVFDALGLSEDERKEVYWSVAELVKARLDKAESV
ncbi:MAG: hypothetical protein ABEJ98_00330, partial [Candidatus Nanohaloarchaea archaeon]